MAHTAHTIRITVASIIAVLLIGGAYVSSGPIPFFSLVEAQSAEELLREYAARDTDGDGLPDWQEALYGTDPNNPQSAVPGVLDGDAVAQGLIQPKVATQEEEETDIDSIPGTIAAPNTLTDRFAQAFLTQYLQNRGANVPSQEEMLRFVEAGVSDLVSNANFPDTYSITDIKISSLSGKSGLETYAAAAEKVFVTHRVAVEKNELMYFSDALRGDSSAISKITQIQKAYASIAKALVMVPVPTEARQAHLSLVNSLSHLSRVSGYMATIDTDPLQALIGIATHDTYTTRWIDSFVNLHNIFNAFNISPIEGVPGSSFIETARVSANS